MPQVKIANRGRAPLTFHTIDRQRVTVPPGGEMAEGVEVSERIERILKRSADSGGPYQVLGGGKDRSGFTPPPNKIMGVAEGEGAGEKPEEFSRSSLFGSADDAVVSGVASDSADPANKRPPPMVDHGGGAASFGAPGQVEIVPLAGPHSPKAAPAGGTTQEDAREAREAAARTAVPAQPPAGRRG